MKKILLCALMFFLQISAFSQVNRETVYLKNGNVLKGDVVGFVPKQSVTIAAVDGDTFVCNLTDIEKITRDHIRVAEIEESSSGYSYHEKGYKFIFSLDLMVGKMSGMKWATIHGVQLNSKSCLGLGLGFNITDDLDFHMSIPVFADFRFDFLENKITPFVEARAGYDVAIEGSSGFYGDLAFGCRLRRFSVSTGIETLRGEKCEYESRQSEQDYYYGYEVLHEGYQAFNFVIRFSLEF